MAPVAGICATIAVLVCVLGQAPLTRGGCCDALLSAAEAAPGTTKTSLFTAYGTRLPALAETSLDNNDAEPASTAGQENGSGQHRGDSGAQPSTDRFPDATEPPPVAESLPSQADPTVAEVRARLAHASLRKGAASDDLTALEAFYGERTGPPLWITTSGFSEQAQAVIKEIEQADDWAVPAEALDAPPAGDAPSTTDGQAIDELKVSLAVLEYARFARGGRISPTRVGRLFDQRPPLIDPKTVMSEIAASPDRVSYLRGLHPKHEQFERLRQALIKVRADGGDNEALIQRLIINMERWRWMPAELGSTYVWNNIPEFKARVVQNGKSIYEEHIIVGKPNTPTPVLSASIQSIVFHPEWLLPDAVVEEELKPALQNVPVGEPSAAILKQRNLKVRLKGSAVDIETVDWTSANLRQYTFVQPPGPRNALGKLKFNFPNRHAVYMHDTSQPELFNETARALSHGCIRLRDPERLAALLLAEDKGWGEQHLSDMLSRGKTKWVKLTSPVPVHLTYFTVLVNRNGELETFPDVYGLDSRMSTALFGNLSKLQATPEAKQ
jgi:murein L,D-transpeptidase YcbB/YkuD